MPVTDVEAGGLRALCSGCPDEHPDPMDLTIHLHHIHLNVSDREASARFYEKFFATEPVRLNEVTEAVYAAPVLLLLDESKQPVGSLPTALQHLGWGSADVVAWYNDARARGIEPDTRGGTLFNTLDTPTVTEPGAGGDLIPAAGTCFPAQKQFSYIYVLGPDDERIEVWTGADKRMNHVHFTTANLSATARWYRQFLDLTANPMPETFSFPLDDILFFFEPIGRPADYEPTDDHVIGHIAFSVTDLDAWLQRATDQAIEIVSAPAEVHGFKSFFVRGPDGMLIELVQAAPLAELCPPRDP